MAAVGRGMGDTYAIFLLPLSQDLGWDRSNIASIYAVYIGAMGVFSPLSGYLFDRFGSRFIYVFGVLCLGAGYWAAGNLTSLWHFYLALGLLTGLAMLTALLASLTLLPSLLILFQPLGKQK